MNKDYANTFTGSYGKQLPMSAQPMLNAAIRAHFFNMSYPEVFCEGDVCSNQIVNVRDKCSGIKCNKDYCNGLDLEAVDPGVGAALGATVGGTIGIFIILILLSCLCRPKTGSIEIDNDAG